MLKSIRIENFRCFEETSIEGFEKVNLITGKNNSGKTTLLEAIFYFIKGKINNAEKINLQDKELINNLFFHQDTTKQIRLSGTIDAIKGWYTLIYKGDNTNDFIVPSDDFFGESHLREVKMIGVPRNRILDKEAKSIVEVFDEAEIDGNIEFVRDAIKIIDDSIEEARTFATRSKTIYLRKVNDKSFMPIYSYGDATQKIIEFIANLVTFSKQPHSTKILLIDEIENGIHHTVQAEVWRMLMKLCKHYNIQLFATTHSSEMIKAFQSVCAEEEFTGMGGYFELGRHAKTQQIIGVKHNLDTLEYELATGDTVRGE